MDPRVRDGLALLRARDWFEAHETLEGPWREAEGERRVFLQSLIQGAVALEHLRRNNPRGAWGQWRKAREKAAIVPGDMDGIGLAAWMAIKAQTPIVPVTLVDTYELLPIHVYHLYPRPIEVVIGEPISTAGMTTRDAEALTEQVRAVITKTYFERHPSTRVDG